MRSVLAFSKASLILSLFSHMSLKEFPLVLLILHVANLYNGSSMAAGVLFPGVDADASEEDSEDDADDDLETISLGLRFGREAR